MKPNTRLWILMLSLCSALLLWFPAPLQVWSALSIPEPEREVRPGIGEDPAEFERLYALGMAAVNNQAYQKAFDYFWRAGRLQRNS